MQLLQRAVEAGQLDGVGLMAELGFEISGITRHDGVGVSPNDPIRQAATLSELAGECSLITYDADCPISQRLCS